MSYYHFVIVDYNKIEKKELCDIIINVMSNGEKILNSINLILKLTNERNSKTSNTIQSFIAEECILYSEKKKEIYEQHDIDNTSKFNFFESISDKWYRENFHSDILFTILNPETKEIGRKYFIQEFVEFLGISDRFNCDEKFEVIKEYPTGLVDWIDDNCQEKGKYGYIDLLIKNKTQAIIIENKINYAPDMKNQLVRYMKHVEEIGIKEYTVVYLTLINDKRKKPPLTSYDKGFRKYTNLLHDKKILKEVYAVDEQWSLAKDFLPACINRLKSEKRQNPNIKETCDVASMYINQYKILLEHLGGESYMSSTDKELIEEIFSDKKKFDAANDFLELWERKRKIIYEILEDKFKNKYNWELTNPNDKIYCKTVNEKMSLFYQLQENNGKENAIQIGYEIPKTNKTERKKISGLLQKVYTVSQNLPSINSIIDENDDNYLYIEVYCDPLIILQDYFDKVTKLLDLLIEQTKEAGYKFN